MNLALALFAGGGLGMGLWLLLVAAVPVRPSLAASLAVLRGNAATPADADRWTSRRRPFWQVQVGRAVQEAGQMLGLTFRSLRRDLTVMDQALEAHLATKAAYAVGGGLVGFALAALLVLAALPGSLVLPLWLGCALAGIGWLVPDRRLRRAAAARRASLRYAAGALLNLVSINLAGGAEVEQALHNALRISDGWAFTLLRNTARRAQLHREKIWDALARLGETFDIDDLVQLAQSISLAGDEGARMREALIAMAASIGQRELAEAETKANEASEHMVLPLAVLAIGFTTFLLYPALVQLTVGF